MSGRLITNVHEKFTQCVNVNKAHFHKSDGNVRRKEEGKEKVVRAMSKRSQKHPNGLF
jgi:hypothetical protein